MSLLNRLNVSTASAPLRRRDQIKRILQRFHDWPAGRASPRNPNLGTGWPCKLNYLPADTSPWEHATSCGWQQQQYLGRSAATRAASQHERNGRLQCNADAIRASAANAKTKLARERRLEIKEPAGAILRRPICTRMQLLAASPNWICLSDVSRWPHFRPRPI